MQDKLSLTDELDFHYLLSLMTPLENEPGYCWLPELFSIIGEEKLILLCKYAGGEIIKIPTLEELTNSIEALNYFYQIYIAKKDTEDNIPARYKEKVAKIFEIYSGRNSDEK